jgi:DNA-binding MarR family transcriptional regulator
MSERWGMFSNHALVLVYVLTHPDSTVREIAQHVGTTERATLGMLRALDQEEIIVRRRQGRRNTYGVNFERLARFRRAQVPPLSPARFIDGLIETLLRLSPSPAAGGALARPPAHELTAPSGSWGFFTNHLRVLIAIASRSAATVREIAHGVGITERATLAILRHLEDEGMVARGREGRRNVYTLDFPALQRSSRWSPDTGWQMPSPIVDYCVRGLRELAG